MFPFRNGRSDPLRHPSSTLALAASFDGDPLSRPIIWHGGWETTEGARRGTQAERHLPGGTSESPQSALPGRAFRRAGGGQSPLGYGSFSARDQAATKLRVIIPCGRSGCSASRQARRGRAKNANESFLACLARKPSRQVEACPAQLHAATVSLAGHGALRYVSSLRRPQ